MSLLKKRRPDLSSAALHEGLDPAAGSAPSHIQVERAEREMRVLVYAGVQQGALNGLCRIRDVSDQGLCIETQLPIRADEAASISLRSGQNFDAMVRWTQDQRIGMSSDANPRRIIQDERAFQPPAGPALPRFVRRKPVQVVAHGIPVTGCLESISMHDVLIENLSALPASQSISLRIGGLPDIPATVQIMSGTDLFATFWKPIGFAVLDKWLSAG